MPISYDMLFGGPTEEERSRARVNQLRRREAFATLGALSGDPVLGEWGRGEMGNVREQAQALRKARQEAMRPRPTGTPGWMYSQNQGAYQLPGYAEQQEAQAAAKREHELNKMRLEAELEGEEGPEYRNLPASMIPKESAQVDMIVKTQGLLDRFQDDFTQPWGPGPQSNFPITLARQGIEVPTKGDATSIEAQSWWADWKKFHEMVTKHEFFGAALTPTEQKAWEEANVGPEMDPKVIRDRISTALEVSREAALQREKVYEAEGYKPGTLEAFFGRIRKPKEEGAEVTQEAEEMSEQSKPEGVSQYDWDAWLQENRGR